jgi:hypothetical protein
MFLTLAAVLPLLLLQQEDRARIADGVESWYMVLQEGQNHGYAFEKLERVRDEWTYEYRLDFILDVPDPKDPKRLRDYGEYWEVKATLDESFQATALRAHLESGGQTVEYSISSEGEKRMLLARDEEKAVGNELCPFPNLLFYSLRQEGRLGRPGRQGGKVLVPRGDALVEMDVQFDLASPRETQGVRRQGMANEIQFLRPLPAGDRQGERLAARVDKYGRILQLDLRGAKLVLVEGDIEAFRNAVTMHRSSRREPFTKAEAMRPRTTPPPEEPQKHKITPDTLSSSLRDLEGLLAELEARKGGDEESLRSAYEEVLALWKPVRELAAALGKTEIHRKADELRTRAEGTWDGSARALADARRCYVRLLEAAERIDPGSADRELRALKDQQPRIEFLVRPEGEELAKWVAQSEPLAARTRSRADLAKRAIQVSGTVISQTEEPVSVEVASGVAQKVRFIRDTSTAVVNGVACRVGDTVEGLRIERISTHSVTVSLRGELREVPLKN